MRRALVLATLLLAGRAVAQPANGWQPLGNGWSELRSSPATGTVTTTGTLASGQVALGSGATSITGDAGCTWTGTGASFVATFGKGILVSDGTALAPSIASVSDPTIGISFAAGMNVGYFGTVSVNFDAANQRLRLSRDARIGWVNSAQANGNNPSAGISGGPGDTALTESSATAFATVAFGASQAVSAEFLVRIKANDATDFQSLTSRVRVSSVRKATGNTVSAVSVIGTDLLAESAGGSTLACTFTVTEGASAATINANCVSSLTQTSLDLGYFVETIGHNVVVTQP